MGGTATPVRATAIAPAEVSATSFVAQWQALPEAADGYTVTLFGVERSTDSDALTLDSDFGSLPESWSLTGEASYSGSKMTLGGNTASKLTTPRLDLARGGALTIRAAQAATSASTLKVYADETLIDQYIPTATASDYVITIPPSEATTLSIAVDRRKSMVIEHVALRQDVDRVSLSRIEKVTESGTSHRFDGLDADREYAYRVAVNGYAASESDDIFVTLSGATGIIEVNDTHEAAQYYNLQGIRVSNPIKGNIYIVKRGNKTYKTRL